MLLLIAASAIMLTALRRRATASLPPLSDEERERLRSLLGRDGSAVAPSEAQRSRGASTGSGKVSPLGPSALGRDDA